MRKYKLILLAVDLHPENDYPVLRRAEDIRQDTGAKLKLVHAVEHLGSYGAAYAYPALSDIQEQLADEAKRQLAIRAQELKVEDADCIVEIGSPKPVIVDAAVKFEADLIIVGSHSRHGFHLFLGSTADAILHDAPCDVLAVRIP